MTAVHGKDYYFSVTIAAAVKDLTAFIKTSSWEVNPDIHDISGSGITDKTYRGGQVARTFTMGGWYDSSITTGPAVLEGQAGNTLPFERRAQGTGSTLPKQTGNLVVGKYVESQKNDDILQWTCDFTITGVVTVAAQA